MSTPQEIQEDIEQTRAELREDVEALQEKVSVRGAAGRRATRMKETVVDVRERVMGSAESARDTVTEVPQRAESTIAGNPLAVGLGAFAIGWLISSLIPATEGEQEVVRAMQDTEAVTQLQESAQEVLHEAQTQGQEAVHEVAEQAKHSASAVAGTAKDKAQEKKSSL